MANEKQVIRESKTDTSLLTFGRKKIEIPLEENELTKENIELYLPDILATHLKNVRESEYLYNFYKGKQPVLNKTKVIRQEINKIIVENHAYEIVEFKKGYEFGKPITYAQRDSADSDDVGMLNKYMVDVYKSKQDQDLGEYMYTMGTGYRWVFPKNDYENIDKESPFDLITSSPTESFVVYSTTLGKKKLFGGSVVIIKNGDDLKSVKRVLTIYTKDKVYTYETNDNTAFMFISEKQNGIGMIPIIEYPINESRISPIEVVMTMLNALNDVSSNELDDVVQFVNSLLVFINQDVTKELLDAILEMGAMQIKTISPEMPADVKELSKSLEHGDIDVLFERIYGKMLSIVGVPKTSDSPRSSGDTGSARMLGEGWTLADQRADNDEKMFDASEHEMLKVVLKICKEIKNCKINELVSSDIDVKFNRSKEDNLLVKTQSLSTLTSAGLPKEVIAQTVNLFSDPHEVAKMWEEQTEKNKAEMLNSISSDKNDSKTSLNETDENVQGKDKNANKSQNINGK